MFILKGFFFTTVLVLGLKVFHCMHKNCWCCDVQIHHVGVLTQSRVIPHTLSHFFFTNTSLCKCQGHDGCFAWFIQFHVSFVLSTPVIVFVDCHNTPVVIRVCVNLL